VDSADQQDGFEKSKKMVVDFLTMRLVWAISAKHV
jgi:hypothetical protein